jgi:hypothetical protein
MASTNKPKFDIQDIPSAFFCDNTKASAMRNEMIKNQVRINECEQGDLETFFFSDENISLINKQLILSVYRKTKGKIRITDQSKESLIIVMRYVFLEHARHLPYDVKQQISELNCQVVGEILPNIITNATQRIDYIDEISKPREINRLPVNVNKKGSNTLPSTSSIFMY